MRFKNNEYDRRTLFHEGKRTIWFIVRHDRENRSYHLYSPAEHKGMNVDKKELRSKGLVPYTGQWAVDDISTIRFRSTLSDISAGYQEFLVEVTFDHPNAPNTQFCDVIVGPVDKELSNALLACRQALQVDLHLEAGSYYCVFESRVIKIADIVLIGNDEDVIAKLL